LPYEPVHARFDQDQLHFFIENGIVELLTADAGGNNVCLITVKLKDGVPSPFSFFDFCTKRMNELRIIIIKVVLAGEAFGGFNIRYNPLPEIAPLHQAAPILNGDGGLIKHTNRQSFTSLQEEATKQNNIYYKSAIAFGAPICPPVLAVVITEGREDLDLFALLLGGIQDIANESSKRLALIIAGIIRNRNSAGAAFIVMGHINSNYKSVNEWNRLLEPNEVEYIPENMYDLYAEFYKLGLIGYRHGDINTGNMMLCNPYIVSGGATVKFSEYYANTLAGLNGMEKVAFINKFKLSAECSNEYSVILIDFGQSSEFSFSKAMSVDDTIVAKFRIADAPFSARESIIIKLKALGIPEMPPADEDAVARLNHLIEVRIDAIQERIKDYRNVPGPIIRLKYENEKYKFCQPFIKKLTDFEGKLNSFVSRPPAGRAALKLPLIRSMRTVEENARSSRFLQPDEGAGGAAAAAAAAPDLVKKEDEVVGGGGLFGGDDDMGGGYRKKTRKNKKANKARRRSAKK